jgi:hypothetical protein
MKIFGTLIKIDSYKRLIIAINEQTYKYLNKAKSTGHVWLWKPDHDENEDEPETKYYCRVNLDRYDSQLLAKRFEPLLKKDVIITINVKKYDFEGKTGANFMLQRISVNKSTVEHEMDRAIEEDEIKRTDEYNELMTPEFEKEIDEIAAFKPF